MERIVVTPIPIQNNVVVTTDETTVNIVSPVTSVVQVNTPGPQGPIVDTSIYLLTSSFNTFTASYNTGSFRGSLIGTSSWATQALTASYVNPLHQNVIITGSIFVTQSHISTVDYIDFTSLTIAGAPAHNQGRIHWSDDTKTLEIDTDKEGFMIEVGHQSVVRVYNDTGNNIGAGTVVYISGSQGNQPKIVTASYEGDPTSAATLGFAATLIQGSGGNKHGYVVTSGILKNVNTSQYSVGTQLYLSSSGQFTNVPPDAPRHEVRLGKVLVSNNTTGVIYVDIMNGYELDELHDLKTTTATNGDLLMYSSSLWTNSKQLTGSYGITGSLTTNAFTLQPTHPLPTTHPAGTLMVSSSTPPKPYFWDGISWNALY